MSALLLAWQAAAVPRLAAVRSEPVEGRPAVVVVVTGGALTDVPVRRDGSDVVVDLAVTAPVLPNAPSVAPPLRSLRIERSPNGVRLRIGITPGLPYDVRVVKHTAPSYEGINNFEDVLQSAADSWGGRNDGWGCFSGPSVQ